MKMEIVSGVLVVIIFSVLSVLVSFIAYLLGQKELNTLILNFLVSLLVLIILGFVFRKKIFIAITNYIIKVILNYPSKHPSKSLGFNKIYKNFGTAKFDIVQDFIKCSSAKLFFQLGKGVIGETNSLLYEHTVAKQNSKDFNLKILSASKNSPYLTENKAKERESRHLEWIKSMEDVEQSIRIFRSIDIKVESKKHNEEFLMKLFIFNDSLYVIPFLHPKKNDDNAPVLRFIRCTYPYAMDKGKNNSIINESLFFLFDKYFESIWNHRAS